MYNYLTNIKRLNDILWLLPFSGSPRAGYDPGKAFVDIAGPDVWAEVETSADTVATLSSTYNSPFTITRDEVPDLK